MAPVIAALLQHDNVAGERWLSFPRPPPPAIRQALHATGWAFHGGLCAWRTRDPGAPLPANVTVGRGGACRYSSAHSLSGAAGLELLAASKQRLAAHIPTGI